MRTRASARSTSLRTSFVVGGRDGPHPHAMTPPPLDDGDLAASSPSPSSTRTLLVRFAPTAATHAVHVAAGASTAECGAVPPSTARDVAAAVLAAAGWAGRLAPDALSITSAGTPLLPSDPLPPTLPLTLHASLARPLPGGGGDGGSTGAECRSAYLEMYKAAKKDGPDRGALARMHVTLCRLSGEALTAPVVVDDLGRLYNKDAVVRALLAAREGKQGGGGGGQPVAAAPLPPHISSLKHVTEATLTRADGGDAAADPDAPRFVCPVTGAAMNGRARFVLLRPSGLVVAERALAVAPAAVREAAGGGWEGPPLLLNPTGEEDAAARAALLARRAAEAAKKAAKKGGGGGGKRAAAAVEGGGGGGGEKKARGPAAADDAAARAARLKATLALAPEGADKAVFASLFTSSKAPTAETFACRK